MHHPRRTTKAQTRRSNNELNDGKDRWIECTHGINESSSLAIAAHGMTPEGIPIIMFQKGTHQLSDVRACSSIFGQKVRFSTFSLSFFRVCSQIFYEAKYILYSKNRFICRQPESLDGLGRVSVRSKHHYNFLILDIKLDIDLFYPENDGYWQQLLLLAVRHLPNLQRLSITLKCDLKDFTHSCRCPTQWEKMGQRRSRNTLIMSILQLAKLPLRYMKFQLMQYDFGKAYLTLAEIKQWEHYLEGRLLASDTSSKIDEGANES